MAVEFPTRRLTKQPALGVPMIVMGVFLALGFTAFLYLQFFSNRTTQDLPLTPEARAYVRNLNLSDVGIKATESYLNQTVVEIDGKISNLGDRPMNLVEIYCIFYDQYGQMVLRTRVPIVSPRMGGLKPGETKSFRLPFDEVPERWNQAMPQLVIAGVKFS